MSAYTSFQDLSRVANLPMAAEIAADVPLPPVVEEIRAVLESIPDSQRGFRCRDGSWSTILMISQDQSGRVNWHVDGGAFPLLGELFDSLGGNVILAALARMAAGDLLDWHYDPCAADLEQTRLHLPLTTNPKAVSDLGHERLHWPVGGLYYGDFGFPHRVMNDGAAGRIHLYFDVPSDQVRDRLPSVFFDDIPGRLAVRQQAVNLHLAARAAAV